MLLLLIYNDTSFNCLIKLFVR